MSCAFSGGCSDHKEPQAAAAEYGQSTFGDDWLPIGDHGGSCNNGYCIDAHIDLGHQAFNDCSAEDVLRLRRPPSHQRL